MQLLEVPITLRNFTLLLVLLFGVTTLANANDLCTKRTCFDKSVSITGQELELKGFTLFEYLVFDVYSIALYLPSNISAKSDVLSDIPKQLRFRYHREISAKDMVEGARKNLAENPEIQINDYKEELATLNSWYTDVTDKDEYTLSYSPNAGTTLAKNGTYLGSVSGAAFAKAYFGIWLSERPLSRTLRNNLLKNLN